jgi:predicted DNA-binding protein
MNENLNVTPETLKLLRENIGKTLLYFLQENIGKTLEDRHKQWLSK